MVTGRIKLFGVLLVQCLAVATGGLGFAPSAAAAPLYWTSSGTWDSSAMWSNTSGGGYSLAWTNSSDAVFEGTAGTVAINGNPQANTVTFNTDGYLITGGSLTLSGAGGSVTTGSGTDTVASVVQGAVGFNKNGTGTLIVTGANTYSGGTTINAGTLQIGNGGASGTYGSGTLLNNSTLVWNSSTALNLGTANAISGSGATTILSGNVVMLTNGGGSISSGLITVSGTGSANTSSFEVWAPGAVTVSNNFVLNSMGSAQNRGGINQDGGGGLVTLTGSITVAGPSRVGLGGSSSNNMVISGQVTGSGGPLYAYEPSHSLTLSNINNNYSGGTVLESGTLIAAGPGAALGSGSLTMDTNTSLSLNGSGTYSGNIIAGGTGSTLTKTGSGIITLSGNASVGNLYVSGGTVTMPGPNSVTVTVAYASGNYGFQVGNGATGTFNLNGGSLSVQSLTTGVNAGGNGRFNQSGGTASAAGFFSTGIGATNTSAVYNMSGGVLTDVGDFSVDEASSNTILFNQTGGAVTDGGNTIIGRSATGKGIYTIAGGSLTTSASYNTQIGGTNSGANGTLNVAGAAVVTICNATGANALSIGAVSGGTGAVNQSGGTVILPSTSVLGVWLGAAGGSASGVYNLNGGLLQTAKITPATSTGAEAFNFSGGTLQNNGTAAMTVGTAANFTTTINAGGAFINTNGQAMTWNPALLAGSSNNVGGITGLVGGSGYTTEPTVTITPVGGGSGATAVATVDPLSGAVTSIVITNPGNGYTAGATIGISGGGGSGASANTVIAAGPGGLTTTGGGTLILTGSSTYAGPTTISGGTLQLGGAGCLGGGSYNGAIALSNNAALVFNTSGAQALGGTISGSGSLSKQAAGQLTLSGSGNLTGNTMVTGGWLALTGTYTSAGMQANGGTLAISGSVNSTGGAFYVGNGDSIANTTGGMLVISNGATLNVTGTMTDNLVVGRDSGSGTLVQNGGLLNYNPTNASLYVAASNNVNTNAFYNMNGGTLAMNGKNLIVGLGVGAAATGTFNQTGGLVTGVGALDVGSNNGKGYFNLTGGSIAIGSGGIVGASTYGINLGGGTVGASAAWSSAAAMTLTGSNGNVTFDTTGGAITLSGILSGTGGGGLTKAGPGNLTLSGANSYSGGTTVGGGVLKVGGASTTSGAGTSMAITNGALGTGLLTINGGTLDLNGFSSAAGGLAGTGTIGNSSTSAAGTLTIVTGASPQTYSGVIANTLGGGNKTLSLIVAGSGMETLNGTNTYTGATSVNGGTLAVNGALAGTSPVTVGASGTLAGSATIAGNASLSGGVINLTSGSISGTLGSVGGYWLGSGTVGGVVTSSAGLLTIGSGATLVAPAGVNLSGGTLAGAGTIVGNASLSGGAVNFGGGSISGTLGSVGGYWLGSGTVGGVVTSSAGLLTIGSSATLVAPAGVNISGGTVCGLGTISGGTVTLGSGAVIAPGATANAGNIGTLTLANLTTGGGTLNFDLSSTTNTAAGSGVNDLVAVTGNLTFGGTTSVSVTPYPGAALTSGTYSLFTYGGSLAGFTSSSLSLADPGILTTRQSYQFTSDGAGVYLDISGMGAQLTWSGSNGASWDNSSGSVWSNNNNGNASFPDRFVTGDFLTFTAASAGTVTLNAAVAPGSVTVSGGTYTFAGPGKITNGTALTVQGSAALTIANTNDYTLGTNLQGGSITLAIDNGLPVNGTLTLGSSGSSGTFDLAGHQQTVGGLAVGSNATAASQIITAGTGNSTLTFSNTAGIASTFYGTIQDTALSAGSGMLSLTVSAGTLDTSGGATTYYGSTTVNGGQLLVGTLPNSSSINIASGAALSVGGANVSLVGAISNSGNVSFTANSGTVTLAGLSGGGSTSFAAGAVFPTLSAGSVTVAGRAWITTASGGTATLNGPSDTIGTLSGAVVTAAGAASITTASGGTATFLNGSSATIGTLGGAVLNAAGVASITTATSGTANLSGVTAQIGSLGNSIVNLAGTVLSIAGGTQTTAGLIGGTGGVVMTGNGTLLLGANNTYTGGTTISGGTLQVGNNNTSGWLGTGPIVNNATLAFSRTDLVAVSQALSGTGNLNVNSGVYNVLTNSGGAVGSGQTINVASGAAFEFWAPGSVSNSSNFVLNSMGQAQNRGAINQDGGAGGVTLTGSIILAGPSLIGVGGSSWNDMAITGPISGSGMLSVYEYGGSSHWQELYLSNSANSYTGGTSIESGYLRLATPTSAGTGPIYADSGSAGLDIDEFSGTVANNLFLGGVPGGSPYGVVGNATLLLHEDAPNNLVTFSGSVTLTANTNVRAYDGDMTAIFSQAIGGTGTLSFVAGGAAVTHNQTWVFGGSAPSTYGNTVIFSDGSANPIVRLGGGALPTAGIVTISDAGNRDAVFDLAGYNQTLGGLTGTPTGLGDFVMNSSSALSTLTIANTSAGTFAGVIGVNTAAAATAQAAGTGNIALVVNGSSVFTLAGNNTYNGGTTVSAGTLQLSKSATLGTGPVTVNAGAVDLNGDALGIAGLQGAAGVITDNSTGSGTTTLTVTQSGNFGGVIQNGSAKFLALNMQGSGLLILAGSNTYSGPTTITAGTLQLGNGGTSGSIDSTSNVVDNGTLAFSRADNFTFARSITGSGGVSQLGTNAVTLTGNSSYTGPTSVSAGTLAIAGTGVLGGGNYGGRIANSGALVFNTSTNQTLSGAISGPGAVYQLGNNLVTLTGTSSYTGVTAVRAGTLNVAGVLGSTAVTVGGGATLTGSGTLGGGVTVVSGEGTGNQGAINLVDGAIGTLTFSGGGNALSLGTGYGTSVLDFELDSTTADQVALTGGYLNMNGSATINLTQLGGTAISAGTYNLISFAALSGSGSFTLGQVPSLPNNLVASLNTTANDEQLIIALGTPPIVYWTGSSGTAWSNMANWATSASGTGSVSSLPGSVSDVYLPAAGSTNLATTLDSDFTVKSLNFTATSAAVTINGSNTLTIATAAGINDPAGSAAQTINANIALGAPQTWTVNSASPLTVGGVISGANTNALTLAGSGAVILTAANTYAGQTTIAAGSLQLGDGATLNGSVTGDILNNSALLFANATTLSYDGAITGSGGVTISGPGTLTLGGANGYSGGTTVSGGGLLLGNASALGTGGLVLAGGAMDLGGFSVSVPSISLTGGTLTGSARTLTVNGPGPIDAESGAVNADLAGNVGLNKTTSGMVLLSGSNTYTGGTSIEGGVLQLGGDAALPNSGNLNVNAGTLDLNGHNPTVGSVAGMGLISNSSSAAATINVNATTPASLGVTVADGNGTTGLIKSGGGTLLLASAANSYSGGTTVSAGVLRLGSTTALGSTAGNLTLGSGTLDMAGNSPTVGALAGASGTITSSATGATLTTGAGGGSSSFDGVIVDGSGPVALLKIGAGTLTLGGASSYKGGTTIAGGALSISTSSNLGSGNVTIDAGALQTTGTVVLDAARTVTLTDPASTIDTPNREDSVAVTGLVTGGGALNKTGAGTLALADPNGDTYSGNTNVLAGTLLATTDNALSPSSNLVIADGASVILDFGGGVGNDSIAAFTGGTPFLTAPALATPALAAPALTPAGISTVPEPSTLMLLLAGALAGVIVWRRRGR